MAVASPPGTIREQLFSWPIDELDINLLQVSNSVASRCSLVRASKIRKMKGACYAQPISVGGTRQPDRREFVRMAGSGLLVRAGSGVHLANWVAPTVGTKALGSPLGFSLRDVAQEAHLDFLQVCGGDATKKYILETTGSGVQHFVPRKG